MCARSGAHQQQQQKKAVPLIDYLCEHFKCSTKELPVVFQDLDTRRTLVNHLRSAEVHLRTTHLRPYSRNFTVHCCISSQNAHMLPAYRGYLDITVSFLRNLKQNKNIF